MFFSEFDNKHIHIGNNEINCGSHFFIQQCTYFWYKHLSNCVTNTSIGPNSKDSLKQVIRCDHWRKNVRSSCFKRPSFKVQTRYQCQKISLHTTNISEPVNDYGACFHLQNRLTWAHKLYRVKNVTFSMNKFVTSALNNG